MADHIYECDDGTLVPSVTTILKILGSEAITRWANYLGFRHVKYDDELERTADIGTIIHRCVQQVVDPSGTTEIVEFKNSFDADYFNSISERFEKYISQYRYETIFTEKTLASTKLGYGGTLDWYAKFGDFHLICDFKSSKQVRLKHLLQLGGYRNLLLENGFHVDGGAIIIVNKNECRMHVIGKDDIEILSNLFNQLASFYKQTKGGELYISNNREFQKMLLAK
jgi:hypothetical protein